MTIYIVLDRHLRTADNRPWRVATFASRATAEAFMQEHSTRCLYIEVCADPTVADYALLRDSQERIVLK